MWAIDVVSERATVPYLWAAGLLCIPALLGIMFGVSSTTTAGQVSSGFLGGAGTAVAVRWFGRFAFTIAAITSISQCVADRGDMGYLGAVLWQLIGAWVVLFCNLLRWGVRALLLAEESLVFLLFSVVGMVAAASVSPATGWDLTLFVVLVSAIAALWMVDDEELDEEDAGLLFFGSW